MHHFFQEQKNLPHLLFYGLLLLPFVLQIVMVLLLVHIVHFLYINFYAIVALHLLLHLGLYWYATKQKAVVQQNLALLFLSFSLIFYFLCAVILTILSMIV